MDSKMILHVDYWDKQEQCRARVSFEIQGFEDYKGIVKGLKSKRLKIVEISIEQRFEIGE
jgi:hypothetical protein